MPAHAGELLTSRGESLGREHAGDLDVLQAVLA
jgi:hypothetical protein